MCLVRVWYSSFFVIEIADLLSRCIVIGR
jgi:hypothetical protein